MTAQGADAAPISDSSPVPQVPYNVSYRPPLYTPSVIVETLHAFYHHGGVYEFSPADRTYQLAMAGFFALPLAIGLLLTVGFTFLQCSERLSCCRCCLPRTWKAARLHGEELCGACRASLYGVGSASHGPLASKPLAPGDSPPANIARRPRSGAATQAARRPRITT